MRFVNAIAGLALSAAGASAHMQLFYPAPFNASNNPHRTTATADPYLEFPYDCCGENDRWVYPCRGYESLLGSPDGAPTATWEAGSTVNFTLWAPGELGGNHYGGSCQVGFSTDSARSFHVATSYEGNCPHRNNGNGPDGQSFDFQVPSDLKPGVRLFAWIWYNREQEFNMNCAAVKIVSPTPPVSSSSIMNYPSSTVANHEPIPSATSYETANGCDCLCAAPVNISTCVCTDCDEASETAGYARDTDNPTFMAFAQRPLMFVADNGNDCETPRSSAELKYPDPGPEVVSGDGVYPVELPSGACGQEEMLAKQAYNDKIGE